MFKKIVIAGLSLFFSMSVCASEDIFEQGRPLVWSSIITLSGGPAWSAPNQQVYLYPTIPVQQIDFYVPNSSKRILATGELFFGLQHLAFPGATGELGIGIAGASNANVTGSVYVNGVPNMGTYRYRIDHGRAELKGKLIANPYWLQPYISASVGAGYNNSHDFRATSVLPLVYPAPWFATRTNIAFAYTLGVGVQAMLNQNWQVGIGYEFADWGKSSLGLDLSSNIIGPSMDHMYTSELLFSISYLFSQ